MTVGKVRSLTGLAVAVWATVIISGSVAARASGEDKTPNAPVKLVSSVSAVAPGSSFDVALAYEVAEDWHIYWKNPGDSGAPPRIKWELPPGFSVGEFRFPAPHRLESGPADFRLITYVHEGEPALLATVTAPADLTPGEQFTIGGQVTTLVCRKQCIMERASVSLRLPTVKHGSQVEPANAELFATAARQIPAADGRGKFVTVSAAPTVESTEIGGTFEVAVTVDIKPGHHIQSNRPYIPGLIATLLIPELTGGVDYGEPAYPKAKERFDRQLNAKLSEFAGKPVIRIPVEINEEAVGTSLRLAGVVTTQACAEKGARCYPPETVAWSTTVALSGAPPAPAPAETTAATETPSTGLPATTEPAEAPAAVDGEEDHSLLGILLLAFAGGIILNVMPCVWPVISIKVMSFVQQAHDDPRRVLRLGLLFGLGILVSFWILGGVAVAAKVAAESGAADTGGATWGTQFANAKFDIAMITVLFVFALSLFGVFEINLPGAASGKLSAATAREGYAGSFVKGMLATVLATPCTAPLLGPAIGIAFSQSSTVIMLAMTAVGLGMGLPYVVLAARPAWLKFLPKPGPWMETFKQFTGFLMMGVVVWLFFVLARVMGGAGVVATISFVTALGLACWVYGKINLTWSANARALGVVSTLVIAVGGGWLSYGPLYTPSADAAPMIVSADGLPPLPEAVDWDGQTPWIPHRPELAQRLAEAGHTVLVNYTAVWCTKCIIEKKTVLETDAVREKMQALGVVPLQADFSSRPAWITKEIKNYGRAGVPLNVILPAGRPDQPVVLPEVITRPMVLDNLEQAGPSKPSPGTELADGR